VIENVYVLPGLPAEMEAMFETIAEEMPGGARSPPGDGPPDDRAASSTCWRR
jgi:hypothetical protein